MSIPHPDWVLAHKKKGTEIRFINGRYYLYAITSKWDKEKKRPVKKTLALLGSITTNGFHPSEKNELKKLIQGRLIVNAIVQKEFGFTNFIELHFADILKYLKQCFSDHWQMILVLSYCRFVYQCPFKKMEFRYEHSYLSELYPGLNLDKSFLTTFIRQLGDQRDSIRKYFNCFWKDGKNNILFDVSSIVSLSELMESYPKKGYNNASNFDPQLNIMLIHSADLRMPMYYRILPGNIREVKAFELCLKEFDKAGEITIITDKGFYSHKNLKAIINLHIHFVIPLRRNNSLIDYQLIINGIIQKNLEGHFVYDKRILWYYSYESKWGKVYLYIDDFLKANEERDYLLRAEKDENKNSIEKYHESNYKFGTIALLTNNSQSSAQEIYETYKTRNEVELLFDSFKNVINADRTYMQNDIAIEAWMFINFIASQFYYIMYNLLKSNSLLKQFSPLELAEILAEIKKIKINNVWYTSEVTIKTLKLLNKLKIQNILSN